jgi:dihydrofolate reductase
MAAFWPTVGDDDPFAKHLNHVTKYVASRNMTQATWEDTTVLNGDVAEQVREIKERDGGTISVLGSCRMDRHSLSGTRRRPAWHVRSIS